MKHIMILFGNSGEHGLNMPHHRSTPAIGIAVQCNKFVQPW
jgi:hypothetical protein